jgi:hypothetical protein
MIKTDIQTRLECLRAANAFCMVPKSVGVKSDGLINVAQKYYDWVTQATSVHDDDR